MMTVTSHAGVMQVLGTRANSYEIFKRKQLNETKYLIWKLTNLST
jgi:hypothetical protein